MNHTIGQRAERIDVPASTLRYYDKEGLLPFIHRTEGGIRVFTDSDIEWLQVIGCRKKAGRSIEDIRKYIQLALKGDDTIELRLALFIHQRKVLKKQREELQHTRDRIEYKCWFYETAKEAGTINVPQNRDEKEVPAKFRKIRKELKNSKQK